MLGMRMSRSATVGQMLADAVDRLAAVSCLGDDGDVGLRVEDDSEPVADQPLVVGEYDGDRPLGRRVTDTVSDLLSPGDVVPERDRTP